MGQPRLSQNQILEILTKEIEALKKITAQINKIYPLVAKDLEKIEQTINTRKIPVDTEPVRKERKLIQEMLQNHNINLKFARNTIISLGVILVMTGFLCCWFYSLKLSYKQELEKWKIEVQQLKEKYEPEQD